MNECCVWSPEWWNIYIFRLSWGGKNENEILLDLKLNFLIIDSVDELVDYFPSLVSFLKNFFILHMRKILFTYVVATKFWLSFGVYISTRSHVKGFFFTWGDVIWAMQKEMVVFLMIASVRGSIVLILWPFK